MILFLGKHGTFIFIVYIYKQNLHVNYIIHYYEKSKNYSIKDNFG